MGWHFVGFDVEEEMSLEKNVHVVEHEVVRTAKGFEVFVKSPTIHTFFRELAEKGKGKEAATFVMEGIALKGGGEFNGFALAPANIPVVEDVNFGAMTSKRLLDGHLLNALFLRSTRLDEGFWISDAQEHLPSNSYGIQLGKQVRRACEELYRLYISPFGYKVKVNAREIQSAPLF